MLLVKNSGVKGLDKYYLIWYWFTNPRLFDLKFVYFYVIEVADSKSNLNLHGKSLISKILLFLKIIMKNPSKTLKTLINSYNSQKHQNNFDQGVHDHNVLVDLVQFPEGGKMQISLKLSFCRANQDQIRNHRPRLRRTTQF